MSGTREIKNRINSVRDTQKITNAMYLISSTKLRKARKQLEDTEPYFFAMQSTIQRLLRHLPDLDSIYLDEGEDVPEDKKVTAVLVITADKGLAGAYNHNVIRGLDELMKTKRHAKLFVVGEVGRHYFDVHKIPIEETFKYTAQNPSLHRARMITEKLLELYQSREIHELYIQYTSMKNSMESESVGAKLLPLKTGIESVHIPSEVPQEEFIMSPSPEDVVNNVLPNYITGYIYSALVESFCSEQNSRMLAMQSANKSANDILHDLSIQYNRVRQSIITQEITEVSSGAKAIRREN
ncbi:MAG: ATP synthase F1 subunit gamma [Lachnospiraceae bacterium]|nr:ATP synthase F1 subunit gamma [Lachnospiraceae bacterium]